MAQNVGARSTRPTGRATRRADRPGARGGTPDQREAHERVHVVRPLEEQAEVALELAVVGGEDHVEVVAPAPLGRPGPCTRPRASSISSFSTWVRALTSRTWSGGERGRHPPRRRLVVGDQVAVVPEPPLAAAGVEDGLALGGVGEVAGGEVEVAPVDPAALGRRRVPRVVWVGEAHPAEPVGVVVEAVEPGDGAVGDPVGVVPAALDRVELHLGGAGVAAALAADLESRGRAPGRSRPWPRDGRSRIHAA